MNMNKQSLEQIKMDFDARLASCRDRVLVCAGTGCVANGSLKIYDKFK